MLVDAYTVAVATVIVVGSLVIASIPVFGAILMFRARRARRFTPRRVVAGAVVLLAALAFQDAGTLPPDRERPLWMEQATDVDAIELVGNAWTATRASYTNVRPRYCYDRRGRHRVPNVSLWTAHPSYPCGTPLEVRRNGSRVVVRVWDHGPNQRVHPERDLDLSRAAFARLDNPSRGVIAVWFRRAS